MNEKTGLAPKRPGRPRLGVERRLSDKIMAAVTKGLLENVHSELTLKEIAATAGTSEAMIQYYFGGKDQLTIYVLNKAIEQVCAGLVKLKADILHLPGNPTWHLVKRTFELAEPHAATTRLHIAELLRKSSRIKDHCVMPRPLDVDAHIRDIIHVLIDAGVYSRSLDVRYASFILMSLLKMPVIFAASLPEHGIPNSELKDERWLAICTSLLDPYFRNPIDLSGCARPLVTERDLEIDVMKEVAARK